MPNCRCRSPAAAPDRSLRWFAFLDGGQVYQEGQKIRASELRYSTGLGISWISPVGPLKLSYAKPLNAEAGRPPRALPVPDGYRFLMRCVASLTIQIAENHVENI